MSSVFAASTCCSCCRVAVSSTVALSAVAATR
jgi:hypothetical protein